MKPGAALLIGIVAFTCSGCGGQSTSSDRNQAIVFAAASLREVVTDIATEYARRGGQPPRLEFDASSILARQIREGARADVFVSAAPEWVHEVEPQQRYEWLGNRLVLVVRTGAPDVELEQIETLALANEQVPAGRYARAALSYYGIDLPARVIYGSSVRDVLSKVSQGGAAAGIVYATDAVIDPNVRTSYTFPPESHPRIVYTAIMLTESGRAFFETLREPWALEIARKYGFTHLD